MNWFAKPTIKRSKFRDHLLELARRRGGNDAPVARDELARLYSEERVREWTNRRMRGGPASAIGKVHQGALNQRMQLTATAMLGMDALAWEGDTPYEVRGMLRSRANTIEGGTTEVNRTIVAQRVLGLPREPAAS